MVKNYSTTAQNKTIRKDKFKHTIELFCGSEQSISIEKVYQIIKYAEMHFPLFDREKVFDHLNGCTGEIVNGQFYMYVWDIENALKFAQGVTNSYWD